MIAASGHWLGWRRSAGKRGEWQAVVMSRSEAECWSALIDWLRGEGGSGSAAVTSGNDPDAVGGEVVMFERGEVRRHRPRLARKE